MSKFNKKVQPSPIVSIRQRISTLRGERESVLSSIEQLQSEKDELEDTLPLLISRLVTLHGGIEESRQEMGVYDGAIGDMCRTYAMILQPGGIDLMTQGGGRERKREEGKGGGGEEEYDPVEEERAMKAAESNYMVDML